jgi:hypothetical protein
MQVKRTVALTTGETVALDELNEEQWESLGIKEYTLAQYLKLDLAKKKELLTTNGLTVSEEVNTKAIWKNIGARIA